MDADLAELYRLAKERLERIRAAWVADGEPLTALGSMGQMVEHPIARQVRDGERHVAMLGKAVVGRGVGRPAVATIRASVGVSPAVKRRLKVAKSA